MKPTTNVKRKCFMISDDRPTELDKSSEYPSDYSEIDSDGDKLSGTSEEEPSIKPTSLEVDEYSLVKFSSKERKCFMISDDRPTELDKSSEYPSDYSEIDSDGDKLSGTSEEEPSIKPTSLEVDEYSLVKFSSKESVL
ncbi:hypothetical protein PR048_029685 [Dryococelus australis]|uniref:Uncharacterized protein n=1 Tax=Dryococelus australis TaxID=614101 RepID=A0ABQ9GEQ2_9NEOP|nr:hypothetical protein PR048_029685 [Dryococelus australis]